MENSFGFNVQFSSMRREAACAIKMCIKVELSFYNIAGVWHTSVLDCFVSSASTFFYFPETPANFKYVDINFYWSECF